MAKRSIEESTLTAIADAIREKGGTTAGLDPEGEMPQAILDIKGAEITELDNEAGGKTVYINSEAPEESEEAMLPEGFTRLKWIQSDGRQYVDTLFKPNQDTRLIIDCEIESNSAWQKVFGTRDSSTANYFGFYVQNTTQVEDDYNNVYKRATLTTSSTRYLIDKNKNSTLVNGTTISHAEGTFQCSLTLMLFNYNGGLGADKVPNGKINACQIYDDNTIVRNYIPCLNASGEAGLWDTVTQAFFGDAAGVGFIAGPVVLDYTLPEGFEELAWIESDGRQYVDTNFKPNQDTTVYCKIAGYSVAANSAVFGSRTSTSTNDQYGFNSNGSTSYRSDYYSSRVSFPNGISFLDEMEITKRKEVCEISSDGSVHTVTNSVGAFQCAYPMYLFAENRGGEVYYPSAFKLSACQALGGITLARYYVPCRTNTGEVGLWDAVNEVFYGDAAGVGFLAGPVVGKGVSKVVLEDEVLIDLTGDTISPETVLAGFIGHDKTGAQFVGELVQNAGGRPFARGTIAQHGPNGTTVSGLPFQPVVVFATDTSLTGGGSDYFIDNETGKKWGFFWNGENVQKISNCISISGDGFRVWGSTDPYYYHSLTWYAIGAEG